MPRKIIPVPENRKGRIIGKRGCTIRKIQAESGAYVDARVKGGVLLDGSEQQIRSAEFQIQSILNVSQNKTIYLLSKLLF
jgi:rRNA processing protein Krr1/Pno1